MELAAAAQARKFDWSAVAEKFRFALGTAARSGKGNPAGHLAVAGY
jgi:hypothetical protein